MQQNSFVISYLFTQLFSFSYRLLHLLHQPLGPIMMWLFCWFGVLLLELKLSFLSNGSLEFIRIMNELLEVHKFLKEISLVECSFFRDVISVR